MRGALALLALGAALAACSGEQAPPAPQPQAQASEAPPPPAPAPSTARDPVEVLLAWAGVMSLRQWDAGYLYWENRGAGTGMTRDQFKAHWGRLKDPEFEVGPGRLEAAAGTRYYTAPVALIDGARRIDGEVVLRRIDAAAGAGPEDQRWHVASHTLEF